MPRTKKGAAPADPADGVQSVILVLQLLEAIAQSDAPRRVTDLAAELATTKPRIFRYLQTLVKHGYIVQDSETDRYRSGPGFVMLGQAVVENLSLVNEARPIMRRLRQALGHSIVLSHLESETLVSVEVLRGTSPFEVSTRRGWAQVFHATAQGKVALAFGPAELAEKTLANPLGAMTPQTVIDARRLRREIKQIAAQGWAVAPNQLTIGINSLAAPLFDGRGDFTGTIAMLDMMHLLPETPAPRQVAAILAAAAEISAVLGYRGQREDGKKKVATRREI